LTEPQSQSSLIRMKAMDLLARREHSFFELKSKLLKKGFNEEQVVMELHQLIDDHLLSDSRFTEIFISSRKEQGKGPLRIESELQKRGIDAGLITSHLANIDENEWAEIACDALEKKLGKGKQVDYDKKLKFMRFLSNRGFIDFQVIEALKHFASSDNNE